MFKQFAPTEPRYDSSSDEEEEQDFLEPVLRVTKSQFVDRNRDLFNVDIRENRKGLGVIGHCEFVRSTTTYAFRWTKNEEYHKNFGWNYEVDKELYKRGIDSASKNGFTMKEIRAFNEKYL